MAATMTATETMTHRVVLPKNVSLFLATKAKREKTTMSKAIASLTEDAILYAEEGHIWEEALEREKTCTGKFLTHEEVWGKHAK